MGWHYEFNSFFEIELLQTTEKKSTTVVEMYDRLPEASRLAFNPAQLLQKQEWLSLQGLKDLTIRHVIASALTAQRAYEIGKYSGLTRQSPNCMSWSNLLEIYPEKFQRIYRKIAQDVAIHLCAVPKTASVHFEDLELYVHISAFV